MAASKKATDPAAIAKSIKPEKSVAQHNLRALLLRLADGEGWRTVGGVREKSAESALNNAKRRGLGRWPDMMVGGPFELTPLGSEVAELLRPRRWRVEVEGKRWAVFGGESTLQPYAFARGSQGGLDACNRIADLLTADDLARAKTYKTEASS
jgi:hypothetical protein